MRTSAVRTRRVVLGDNVWRDEPIAMDERDESDERHSAALEHARDCSDEQLEELQGAIDMRRGSADRRARARDGRRARDGEIAEQVGETSTRSVLEDRRGRDALPDSRDHRRDFRSGDTRERDEAYAHARDRRPGGARDSIATDSAARACDLEALFPSDGNRTREE